MGQHFTMAVWSRVPMVAPDERSVLCRLSSGRLEITAGGHGYWKVPSPDRPHPPARNRVTPLGDIVAIPLRGAWTGNRGILHRGREIVRFHAGNLWIACALEFNGRWH